MNLKLHKKEMEGQLEFMKEYSKTHPLVYKQKTIKQILTERKEPENIKKS